MTKPIEIIFEPGCFDQFEGTQEELDQLISEIKSQFEGKSEEEIQQLGRPVDFEELMSEDPELAETLLKQLANIDNPERKLQ